MCILTKVNFENILLAIFLNLYFLLVLNIKYAKLNLPLKCLLVTEYMFPISRLQHLLASFSPQFSVAINLISPPKKVAIDYGTQYSCVTHK